MIVFILTVVLAWWLTKVLWGEKIGKLSLFVLLPIGIFGSYGVSNSGDSEEQLIVGFLLSILFGVAFVAVNFIAFMIALAMKTDWSNPEYQRAFIDGMFGRTTHRSTRSTFLETNDERGEYRIQYRSGSGSWIDGPGSNDERQAEIMFDNYINNDSRNNRRCRLVYKVNGRVRNVVSTN
jgi:hypothetical protein